MMDFNIAPDGLFEQLDLGEFKATWVGEYPRGHGVAFGSEDGRILLIDNGGSKVRGKTESNEAINGMAFSLNWMGVSTRDDVCFVNEKPDEDPMVIRVPYGSHGVIVRPDGHFLAPLGTAGFLSFKPVEGEDMQTPVISSPRGRNLYFYRMVSLTGPSGQQVIAAVTRKDGIAAMPFESQEQGIHTLTFESLDAIDLCPLGKSSLSIAAIGKDGTIMMCRDVIEETLKKQASVTTRFPEIRGTAYRILSTMGHLIVITSHAIYFLGELAANFLQGKADLVTILEFPIKAIDANIISENCLMVVTSRGVLKFDLKKLNWSEQRESGQKQRVGTMTPFSPAWHGHAEQLVGAGSL